MNEIKIKKEISDRGKKTIDRLRKKADYMVENARMPSIRLIHELLEELNINHYYNDESYNTVEHRNKGNVYVNSRYEGKKGKKIEIKNHDEDGYRRNYLELDSSNSYYSWNTSGYADDLLEILSCKGVIEYIKN